MEENILISNLNDFIFCPRSIYFHNLYSQFDDFSYKTTYQINGSNAHKSIDNSKYSTKKNVLMGIDVYSEELGLIGKIDIFDVDSKTLIERKNKIKKIYDGYLLQVHAQYFCLIEMGYDIKKIKLYSISDNKSFSIKLPGIIEKNNLKKIINEMKNFDLNDKFTQNPNKCKKCIYRELCDVFKDDESS